MNIKNSNNINEESKYKISLKKGYKIFHFEFVDNCQWI